MDSRRVALLFRRWRERTTAPLDPAWDRKPLLDRLDVLGSLLVLCEQEHDAVLADGGVAAAIELAAAIAEDLADLAMGLDPYEQAGEWTGVHLLRTAVCGRVRVHAVK